MSSPFGAFRVTAETRQRPRRDRFRPVYCLDDDIRRDLLAVERMERDLEGFAVDDATARRILREALARNTYGTVSIEGNPLTLTQVQSLLAAAPSPVNAAGPAERDVLNIATFLDDLDRTDPPATPIDLERLHARLFDGTVHEPGRFKEAPNFIGSRKDRTVVYVPSDPEHVRPELEHALDWFRSAEEHPLVRVAVFFHELQSIHPFIDGNGRLGRAVAALQMHHLGYPSVRYATIDYMINDDRDGYYHALANTQQGTWDLTPWVRYWLRNMRRAYDDATARFLLGDRLRLDLEPRALDVATWIARRARVAPDRRFRFNDIHAAFPHLTRRTLQRTLRALVDIEILHLEGKGRGAAYRFLEDP